MLNKSFYLSCGIALISASCTPKQSGTPEKPNVLFISIDDLRPELGCYGVDEIQTPHLDKFATKGVTFTRAYCQTAACAPSRASIMTGLRPDSTRVWHLKDKFRQTIPDVLTMPQYFHKHGYYTVSMGKIFHNHMPDSISFDEPDLRPEEYRTKDMIDRDPESFYYDEAIKEELRQVRDQRLKKNPNAYAGGWGYGRAFEIADCEDHELYDGAQTDLAIETMKRLKEKEQPFFLALGYYRPHLPFVAPRKYWELYDRDKLSLAPNPFLPKNSPVMAMNSSYELSGCYDMKDVHHPSVKKQPEEMARKLKHGYYASVSYVDACVGKLLKGLDDLGLAENTIVVVWGDHGWKLGEHGSWCKQTNYNIDTRVPLLIYAPGIKGKGQKCDRLVELLDLFPTIGDLAGIEVESYLQGTSMVPLLNNPNLEWKEMAFSQFHRRPKVTPDGGRYMGYSMTTDSYHLVEWYVWDDDKGMRKEFMARELYNHRIDPEESENIAGYPENRDLVLRLSEKLKANWNKKFIYKE